MRTMIAIPVVIALTAAAGFAICAVLGWNVHAREMIFAAVACLAAAELACLPLLLTRGASQPAVAQAALAGTMIHLFASAALGGSMLIMKSLRLDSSIVYWLLPLYWMALIVIVVGYVRAVKTAPVGAAPMQPR